MDRELTPDEIADLLPAYALDAVDDDERAADRVVPRRRVPTHATRSPSFQVAASMLAHTGGPPPDGVWERLESIISASPPPPRVAPPPTVLTPRSTMAPTARSAERRWRWLAAAAAVVALAFGGLWLAERGDGNDTQRRRRRAGCAPPPPRPELGTRR